MAVVGVHPYIITNGNGQEAVKFYEDALEAEVLELQTYADLPPNPEYPLPEEAKNLIVHCNMKIGTTFLMLSDNFPSEPYQIGDQVNIALLFDNVEKSKVAFEKLSEGGEVVMPLQETPWSPSFGQVKDKYGVKWQISTTVE